MMNKKNSQKKNISPDSIESDKDLTKALKHKPYLNPALPFPQKQYEPEADKIK